MAADKTKRRVLLNDDGWIMGGAEPPLTVNDLKREMVDVYDGTPVDVILWSVGGHEVFYYETEVGEIVDDGNAAKNLKHLVDEVGGPLTALTKLYHDAGLELFASVRMNEHYDIDPSSSSYGRMRREHPELLIGRPDEVLPEGSLEWGIRTGINYTFPEIRAFMARLIIELFERFDIDGVELDFMRHPAFFRIEEAYANRYLMTDLVTRIRDRMKQISAARDRHFDLAVRVPPTIADCTRIGLDIAHWIKAGLVDMVIAGGGFIPFDMPIEEFVDLAKDTNCPIYGCLEKLRPTKDAPVMRAVASRYWRAGVDGLYLMNYHTESPEWKKSTFNEIADPTALKSLDKRYQMDRSSREAIKSQLGLSFRNAIPAVQLPVTLTPMLSERGTTLRFNIADNVATTKRTSLMLRFDAVPEGQLDIRLNDSSLALESADRTQSDDGFEMTIAKPPLNEGENELEIRLGTDSNESNETVVLLAVEVSVEY